MEGYDLAARTAFVEWNKAARDHVGQVAVVTDNSLWRMVVSSMGLATGQSMKAFDSVELATAWIGTEA